MGYGCAAVMLVLHTRHVGHALPIRGDGSEQWSRDDASGDRGVAAPAASAEDADLWHGCPPNRRKLPEQIEGFRLAPQGGRGSVQVIGLGGPRSGTTERPEMGGETAQ